MQINKIQNMITNIQKVTNDPIKFRKGLNLFTAFMAGSLFGTCTNAWTNHMEHERITNNIKTEVKNTGISQNDYEKIDDNITIWNTEDKAVAWQHVLDSIKMHGDAQKSYFEAGQNIIK